MGGILRRAHALELWMRYVNECVAAWLRGINVEVFPYTRRTARPERLAAVRARRTRRDHPNLTC